MIRLCTTLQRSDKQPCVSLCCFLDDSIFFLYFLESELKICLYLCINYKWKPMYCRLRSSWRTLYFSKQNKWKGDEYFIFLKLISLLSDFEGNYSNEQQPDIANFSYKNSIPFIKRHKIPKLMQEIRSSEKCIISAPEEETTTFNFSWKWLVAQRHVYKCVPYSIFKIRTP